MAYRPLIGGQFGAPFPLQFPDALVSVNSLSSTPVHQLSNDGEDSIVSHGSGFLWRHAGTIFLVSARHVITGRDPFLNQLMSPTGFIPRRFQIFPAIEVDQGQFVRSDVVLEIDPDGERSWAEDPEFSALRTDIAAIPIPFDHNYNVICLNDAPDNFDNLLTNVGFDCSILGYPHPSPGGLMTPVWRRGAFASEPLLPVDNKPMFLVDALTSPGFSGAAVFRTHVGPAPVPTPDGTIRVMIDRILTRSFVGVYAGRLQHRHFGGEVPFVFYGNRIPIIMDHYSRV
ncbi:hypothetical protein [Antarcticirhabdus aurantiaca]|uniref:Uncharacterized protein n=1 Tax=Antarcticirhabdus aurantiaca TaxID=2606717 RepID=A0ACD4NMQ8_9HYPH|nr:hypothetical protein [Antarcticirhabdus aurantiaca]WAJ28027.1 hypothetical protein OXU80_24900 [Jeongeuplla avenae]